LAVVLFAAIAPCVLMTAPVVAAQYAAQLCLGPARIGQLFSVELAAMSLATLPSYYWLSRWNWRRVAFVAAGAFVLVNLLSAYSLDFHALLWLRALSALAGGTLMVICIASASGSAQPERVYGLWVSGQLVLGALGLWVLPALFAMAGLKALYLSLALLMALCMPLAGCFPAAVAQPRAQSSLCSAGSVLPGVLGVLAVLLFYAGLSAVWTFIGSIAAAADIDALSSGQILSIATVLGILGSLCATLAGSRWSRRVPLLGGYAVMAAAVVLLMADPGLWRFALAALLFKYAWTFVLPFILATLASFDQRGRLMSTVNLVIGGGLALGPMLAGPILERAEGMSLVLLGSACCLLLSCLLLMLGQLLHKPPVYSFASTGVQP
jgi:predicted MFS family arabinose efflux permease